MKTSIIPANRDCIDAVSTDSTLLDRIRALRAATHDGLNDSELTHLLLADCPVSEEGFSFACFSDGCVTLAVPRQNTADWYPPDGWIASGKEALARELAERHGLEISEPPDSTGFWGSVDAGRIHHHLALYNSRETVIVIHPRYLKIRLFGKEPGVTGGCGGATALFGGTNLLRELASFYAR